MSCCRFPNFGSGSFSHFNFSSSESMITKRFPLSSCSLEIRFSRAAIWEEVGRRGFLLDLFLLHLDSPTIFSSTFLCVCHAFLDIWISIPESCNWEIFLSSFSHNLIEFCQPHHSIRDKLEALIRWSLISFLYIFGGIWKLNCRFSTNIPFRNFQSEKCWACLIGWKRLSVSLSYERIIDICIFARQILQLSLVIYFCSLFFIPQWRTTGKSRLAALQPLKQLYIKLF